VWERDLPRGVKSKERVAPESIGDEDRGAWLGRIAEDGKSAGGLHLPFSQTISGNGPPSREQLEQMQLGRMSDDYFTLGTRDQQLKTYASSFSRTSSQSKKSNSGPRGLTNPQMT